MKKLLVGLCAIFICTFAIAHTVEWYVDGDLYQTTTCNSGDNITPPTAPAKYGYTFNKWGVYDILEYIESTGTQYIDTEYLVGNKNFELSVDFQPTALSSYNSVYGARISTTASRLDIWWNMSGGGGYGLNDTHVQALNNFTTNRTQIINTRTSVTKNGNTDARGYINNAIITRSMYVFAANTDNVASNHFIGKVYAFSIKDNDIVVLNLIPVKNSQGEVGMYDTVTGRFFANQGTGEFIAGPEVGAL